MGHGGASGTRAAVDLENDLVVVILTQAGSKNARPLIGGGHKLAMEILAQKNLAQSHTSAISMKSARPEPAMYANGKVRKARNGRLCLRKIRCLPHLA